VITSQNADNKHAYEVLFRDATKALIEAEVFTENDSITTLEEYFCNLKTLHGLSDRYIMLPLDETPFDIDANSRNITVPANFKKNGLSVQGDEIAETIFFRIDRFFDAMDLDTCDIYVQWQGVENIPYVTPIVMKDVESQPGKILFAWPISSKLTKNSGNVKFSVRFIKQDATGLIVYSFSTLTATAVINPALNFDIFNAKEDNADELFAVAIENSTTVSGIPAAKPVFVQNLPSIENSAARVKLYLVKVADSNERTYSLSVSAKAADTGAIRYEWYHAKEGKVGAKVSEGEDAFIATLDATPDASKNYYTKINETTYELYDVSEGFDPEVVAYEKYNQFTLSGTETTVYDADNSITGSYFVTAINRFGNKENDTDSYVVEFPTAAVPVIAAEEDIADGVIGMPNGTLTVKCTVDPHSYTTFSWKRDLSKNGEFTEEVNVSEDNASTTPSSSFIPTLPGYYKVDVTSEINLDAVSASSSIVRITDKPAAVEFDADSNVDAPDFLVNINDYSSITAGVSVVPGSDVSVYPADLQSDKITYTWYQDLDGKGVLTNGKIDDDAVAYSEPTTTSTLLVKDTMTGLNLRCVAANELNGVVTYSSSKLYAFIGVATE
jgi:hypothetical protein